MKDVNSIQAAQTEATTPAVEVLYSKGYIAVNDDFYDESYDFEPLEPDLRRKCDIHEELHQLSILNWYALLMCIRLKVEQGEIQIDESKTCQRNYFNGDKAIGRDCWEKVLQQIKYIESWFAEHDLEPRTDFESGMISGKLFALRWVLGYEWHVDYEVIDSNRDEFECGSLIRHSNPGDGKAVIVLDYPDINPDSRFVFKVRPADEIFKAENILRDKVWHTRHLILRERIDEGLIKVVEREDYQPSFHSETICRDTLERALQAARKVEQLYGCAFLGPWSDYEWGIVNGKLSALRWVLGDDWDALHT